MKISCPSHTLLLLFLAASGALPLRADPEMPTPSTRSAGGVNPVVGKWATHHHITVTFYADGTGVVSDGSKVIWKAMPSQPGTYTYAVTWPQRGFLEELSFSEGAQTALLIGDNQENYTARRIPDPIVGKWDWHHHQTVTFKNDGTCEMTDGMHGTWRYVDGPDAERRYAVNFSDGRYKDELTFNKDGRTALLVGNNRENYTVSRAAE